MTADKNLEICGSKIRCLNLRSEAGLDGVSGLDRYV